jgi:hypothetical protein
MTGQSRHEKKRVTITREHTPLPPLCYTRQQVADLLSCSVMTVMRLEAAGELESFGLTPGTDNSRKRITANSVHGLIARRAAEKRAAS